MKNFELYDLMVNDLPDPMGIDEAARFSWKLRGNVNGVRQSAYRVEVRCGERLCYDSGKRYSDQTVDVPYLGEPLRAAQTYTVCVTVWDGDGESDHITGSFVTGLLNTLDSYGAKWISVDDGDELSCGDTLDYTIHCRLAVLDHGMGIVFGAPTGGNYYMFQLRIRDGHVQLAPHVHIGAGYDMSRIDPALVDLTEKLGMTPEDAASGVELALHVTAGEIVTSVNGRALSVYPIEAGMPVPELHRPGVRASGGEEGTISDYHVTGADGRVLFAYDFSQNPFHAGTVRDGVLRVRQCGEQWSGGERMSAFRRTFDGSEVRSALLYVSSLGIHQTYLNGERLYRLMPDGEKVCTELMPGFLQVDRRKCYFTFDVTHMLRAGENVLSAVVAGGWWMDSIVRHFGQKNAYWAVLLLTDQNGNTRTIVTDSAWKGSHEIPLRYAAVYVGERYDARVPDDFLRAGFDDSGWKNVVYNEEFRGELCAHRGTRVSVRHDLERHAQWVKVWEGVTGADETHHGTICIRRSSEGFAPFELHSGETAVIDFGQNFAGREAFTVRGAAGTTLTIRHGEMLNDCGGLRSRGNDGPEGSVYTINLRSAKATTHYTLRGENDTYHPLYTYYGFRYLSITADAPVVFDALVGEVLTNVNWDSGCIETGSADVNRLIQNGRWGMYSNYVSVPTDCPQRDERLGWSADTQVFSTTASYFSTASKSFLSKWLRDMRDTQHENGGYTSVAPFGTFGADAGALGWADAGMLVPYFLYTMYGSTAPVLEMYDSMKRYMDGFLASTNGNGPRPNYGDWLSVEPNSRELQEYLGVCYYAWDALIMAEMAQAIGKTADAAHYRQVYEQEKAIFCARYVKEDGTLTLTQQTADLFALKLGLLPDEKSVEAVKAALRASMDAHGYHVQTGFLGTSVLATTLSECGMSREAYRLLMQTEAPSWLYAVKAGATTIWERWNSYSIETGFGDVGMNSFNHYAYGVIVEWMFRCMAGICPLDSFRYFRLAPQPDACVGYCRASFDSAFGRIVSEWTPADNGGMEYHFIVPANTRAEVVLPDASDAALTCNGAPMQHVRIEDGCAVFTALPGEYYILVK